MTKWSITDRTIALAGVLQALALVRQVAKTGQFEAIYFEACIDSIFKVDANTPLEIFAHLDNLNLGMQTLDQVFSPSAKVRDYELIGYLIQLVTLERKLRNHKQAMHDIQAGITKAKQQAQHFGTFHENVVANLAHLYQQTISPLGKKVMIQGTGGFLQIRGNPEKVRALLLAAMRACVLWRQTGGGLWQLFLQRKKYVLKAQEFLSTRKQ